MCRLIEKKGQCKRRHYVSQCSVKQNRKSKSTMEIFVWDYVTFIFFKKNQLKNHEQGTLKHFFFTTQPTVTVR